MEGSRKIFTRREFEQLKRDAKRTARANNSMLATALDDIAALWGYRNWSLLANRVVDTPRAAASPVMSILAEIQASLPRAPQLYEDCIVVDRRNPALCALIPVFGAFDRTDADDVRRVKRSHNRRLKFEQKYPDIPMLAYDDRERIK